MNIYVINLDRHPQRMARMSGLLNGLAFERIAAVDGMALEGADTVCFQEERNQGVPQYLSRFELACTFSHRKALEAFLAGTDDYACILEDDVLLSCDFPEFIRDESWIPTGANLIKIETFRRPVVLGRTVVGCLSRSLAPLLSEHLGCAGYILNREAARKIVAKTISPARIIDHLVFGSDAIRESVGVYQLVPALCVQVAFLGGAVPFPELNSSIQFRKRKPLSLRLKNEIARPFRQSMQLVQRIMARFGRRDRHCLIEFK